jgi:hypothetical protein
MLSVYNKTEYLIMTHSKFTSQDKVRSTMVRSIILEIPYYLNTYFVNFECVMIKYSCLRSSEHLRHRTMYLFKHYRISRIILRIIVLSTCLTGSK